MDHEIPILNTSIGDLLKNDMNMSPWKKRRSEAPKLFRFSKYYTALQSVLDGEAEHYSC